MTDLTPELLATYAESRLRVTFHLDWEQPAFEIRPAETANGGPPRQAVHVLGAWNPGGRPTGFGENIARHEELLESEALGLAGGFALATVFAADLSWAEQALGIEGHTDQAVAELARECGQPAFYRWDTAGIHVIETATLRVRASTPVVVTPLTFRPCPMQPLSSGTEVCVRPGGPYGGAAMAAAFHFERDREVKVSTLGCDVCHGGPVRGAAGSPIGLQQWSVASRYGPAVRCDGGES